MSDNEGKKDLDKPTVAQVCWILKHLSEHMEEGGTFRYLIHNRFGFDIEAYHAFLEAGGMELSNALDWISTMEEISYKKHSRGVEVEYTSESNDSDDPKDPN